MFYGYRSGSLPVSQKALRKLSEAEAEAYRPRSVQEQPAQFGGERSPVVALHRDLTREDCDCRLHRILDLAERTPAGIGRVFSDLVLLEDTIERLAKAYAKQSSDPPH